jgi:hypothetical protein
MSSGHPPSVHLRARRSTQQRDAPGASCSSGVTSACQPRTMLSKPLAHPSALDRRNRVLRFRRPTWRGSGARRSHGSRKSQQKATPLFQACFSASSRGGAFLSRAGPQALPVLFKLSITPLSVVDSFQKRRRRPVGRPRSEPLCACVSSA